MPDYTPTSHAPLPRDPYEGLTKLPEFTLTSTPWRMRFFLRRSSPSICSTSSGLRKTSSRKSALV